MVSSSTPPTRATRRNDLTREKKCLEHDLIRPCDGFLEVHHVESGLFQLHNEFQLPCQRPKVLLIAIRVDIRVPERALVTRPCR